MALLGTYLEYIGCNGKRVPRGHWKNKENHKKYMDWLRKKEGYNTMEDLYKINIKVIQKNGSVTLLLYYNSSISTLITSIYPNYNWLIWKFQRVPIGYWEDIKHQKEYMEWLKLELGYTTPEDWYKISKKVLQNNYGGGILKHYNNSPIKLITSIYPNYNWVIWKFIVVPNAYWKDIKHQKEYIEWLKL